jgi:3-(3-hydroxy-phenyl)propionate hydroxylase
VTGKFGTNCRINIEDHGQTPAMKFSEIPKFKYKEYAKAPELSSGKPSHKAIVIVGSGPIGLAAALDLAQKGHPITILSAFDFIALGSKAICFAKQSLDIFDRLGIGERIVEKGVVWNIGKLFWKDQANPVFQFDMLPVTNQKNPGFVNIQQYHVEDYLVDALEAMDNVDIRWGHSVSDLDVRDDGATLDVETRDGVYKIDADYVLACDGSGSKIRDSMGLDFEGRIFEDNFLIADIKFKGKAAEQRPSERWFWFDPPFCPGGTALLHKQPDDVWRLDFQLGWNINREAVLKPENVEPYVKGMLGEDIEFEREWYSVYTFQCRRMERFVHGPVIFVGDSAHLVSPFGARGANGGLSDAENIAWKIDLVLRGKATRDLLESYNEERVAGADENILNSSRSTDFMTPKNDQSMAFRDAVLELSNDYSFARPFINSGRLSTPTPYRDSPLSTADRDIWENGPKPGFPCVDAPLNGSASSVWLLEQLGKQFKILQFGGHAPITDIEVITVPANSLAADRYDARGGGTYLIRPDQVVAARWKSATSADIDLAYARATGATA